MSKCEISIDFDRPERIYRGGETVRGRVQIRVNQDLNCRGIKLTHYWKTHGRGNRDSGARREQRLAGTRQLLRGETLSFPFEFVAECEPVTYRGHYVNIDHYVRVDIDVPWAFDPKAEEEYIVRPGKPPARLTGKLDAEAKPKANTLANKIVLCVVLAMLAPLMIVFLPLLLVGVGIYWMVRKAVEGRVGKVELIAPKTTVAPGEAWPVELRLTPRKTFPLNAITVKIVAQEAATHGSGTDRTTYRHTVYEETHTLHPSDTLMRGKPFYRQAVIPLPETDAFTFKSSENAIEWWAEVRIDMPGFPDWSQKQTLEMIPREFLEAVPERSAMTAKAT